jgi:HNH endonuclease
MLAMLRRLSFPSIQTSRPTRGRDRRPARCCTDCERRTMITAQEDLRFTSKTERNPETGCIEWTGATCRGYGAFHVVNGTVRAHRWIYEAISGPLDPGLFVRHRCHNPKCVNPAHLIEGTPKDNSDDMVAADRSSQKVTNRDAATIIGMLWLGHSQQDIADEFGVTQQQISLIKAGARRKDAIDLELDRDLASKAGC